MTIEERLNEIVEKGQGDAIIPFLQGLTQEERKSLVPCLNKLEEHYNKFVQLTPQLKVRYISWCSTLPAVCSQLNTSGHCQEDSSITA